MLADDSHNYHIKFNNHSNTGRGWIMVNSQKIKTLSLIKAMEKRDFYSSSGILLKSSITISKTFCRS